MSILPEIIYETYLLLKSTVLTIIGFVIKFHDSPGGERTPVILIPGIMGGSLVWGRLRKKLIQNGFPVYTPNLNFQLSRYEKNGKKLEDYILSKNLRNFYILGHSAGGIIATQMGYRGRDRLRKLFAIASPFHGSLLAFFIFFIPSGRQLIPWSSFLKNNEVNFNTFPNLQSLYSIFDLIIVPGFQARLGRNDDVAFNGLGHLNIFMGKKGVDFLMDIILKEENKNPVPLIQKKKAPNKADSKKVSTTKTVRKRKGSKVKPKKNGKKVAQRGKTKKKNI